MPALSGKWTNGKSRRYLLYCGGSCVVTQEKYDEYDQEEIDEVSCPHCREVDKREESEIFAFTAEVLVFVTQEKYDEYDREEIDEVIECRALSGSGQTGGSEHLCACVKVHV